MAVSEIVDTSKTREKMNEKSKIPKKDDKRTFVIAQEIKLAKILAGNNKTLRERALKRLKRWFQFRSQSTPFTENDFMRIWKGLFYAMWMSDKPILQEECANMIASLVHLTTTSYSLMFFKCGLRTLGNEWFGIDQLRLDKFLMFVRRLLRQAFVILKKNSWNLKTIKEFNNVLSSTILNVEDAPPVGMTMHFTEIYLEELAKVSEGNLKPNLMTEFVSPFIKQLVLLKDKRQIICINKHIFRYLIRQSDLGMEYEEKFKAWKNEGFPGGSIDAMQKQELFDDEKMSDEEEGGKLDEDRENILDPRAGHVDVILPQLKFIPKQILEVLNQNKFKEGSNSKSRKVISTIIDEYTQLSKGQYPLGIQKLHIPKDDGYSTKTKNAVNRLVKFENKLLNKTNKKGKRKNDDELQEPSSKKKRKNSQSDKGELSDKLEEFIRKSEDNIKTIGKKEKKDKIVLENDKKPKDKKSKKDLAYDKKIELKKKKQKLLSLVEHLEDSVRLKTKAQIKNKISSHNEESKKVKLVSNKVALKKKINKCIKKKIEEDQPLEKNYECAFKRNSGTWFVYDDDISSNSSILSCQNDSLTPGTSDISLNDISPSKSGKQFITKCSPQSSKANGDKQINNKSSVVEKSNNSSPKLLAKNNAKDATFKLDEWDVPLKEGETEVFVEAKKYKKKLDVLGLSPKRLKPVRSKSLDSQIVRNPFAQTSTPGSSKKVKIALDLNKAQDIHEHVALIKSSPGIPFDANKKPSKPLLKRRTMGPLDPFSKKLQL